MMSDKARNPIAFWLAFFICAALLVAPIVANSDFPFIDLHNHLARHYIATNLDNPWISEFYDYQHVALGNSSVDNLRALLAGWVPAEHIQRLALGIYIINYMFSVCCLARVIWGRWKIWALAAGLVAYNGNVFMGFENYVFATPFILYALSIQIALQKSDIRLRLGWLFMSVALISLMHYFAVILLGIILFVLKIVELFEEPRPQRLAFFKREIWLALPFLFLILAIIYSKSTEGDIPTLFNGYSGLEGFAGNLTSLVSGIALKFWVDLKAGFAFEDIAILGFVLIFPFILSKFGRLEFKAAYKIPLLLLLYVAILMPDYVYDAAFLNIRLPFLLVAIFFAVTSPIDLKNWQKQLIILVIIGLTAAQSWGVHREAAKHSQSINDLKLALEHLPVGAKVLPLVRSEFPYTHQTFQINTAFDHIYSYAVVERQAFIPTLFKSHGLDINPKMQVSAPQVASVAIEVSQFQKNPATGQYDIQRSIVPGDTFGIPDLSEVGHDEEWYSRNFSYTENWKSKFTHAILVSSTPDHAQLKNSGLVLIESRGLFHIFEISKAAALEPE
ncbi:MAG: hypothetical protein AAF429_01840 [Pseudomonadota bacterium]